MLTNRLEIWHTCSLKYYLRAPFWVSEKLYFLAQGVQVPKTKNEKYSPYTFLTCRILQKLLDWDEIWYFHDHVYLFQNFKKAHFWAWDEFFSTSFFDNFSIFWYLHQICEKWCAASLYFENLNFSPILEDPCCRDLWNEPRNTSNKDAQSKESRKIRFNTILKKTYLLPTPIHRDRLLLNNVKELKTNLSPPNSKTDFLTIVRALKFGWNYLHNIFCRSINSTALSISLTTSLNLIVESIRAELFNLWIVC